MIATIADEIILNDMQYMPYDEQSDPQPDQDATEGAVPNGFSASQRLVSSKNNSAEFYEK